MNLSPRERQIAIIMVLAVGFLLVYYVLISPYMEKSATLDEQIRQAESQINDAADTRARVKAARATWTDLVKGGLQKDVASADSQVGHALNKWKQNSNLVIKSVKSDNPVAQKDFFERLSHVAAEGNQANVVEMLWQIETATMPIRITDMALSAKDSSKSSGTESLKVELGIVTLSENPDYGKGESRRPAGGSPTERGKS